MSTMTGHRQLRPGMVVECPRRSSVGPHDATVTHIDPVGSDAPRTVASLDCGHEINMVDGHGLYVR